MTERKLIPAAELRVRLGGISRTTAYNLSRHDPAFPPTVKIGKRSFHEVSDEDAYVELLKSRSSEARQNPGESIAKLLDFNIYLLYNCHRCRKFRRISK